jgi:PPM family protein phosphatase
MTIALRYTVRSDVGLLREGNEDSAYAGPHLLAIADGMGGHAAGEVASAVAIARLAPLDADMAGIDMLQALADAIADANAELRQIAQTDPSTEGMGTTLTALLWSGDEAALCHIGDSRGYLLRDGVFHQITHDHTLVQSLVDEGRLTPEAAASHPQRSLVMRALQSGVPAEPDLAMIKAKLGDRYLLCSDGLSDVVSDDTVHKTLMQHADLEEAVGQLVDLAIRSGGPDNITCVLADVIDTGSELAPSRDVIIVGALTGGADQPVQALRSDSPAARAHLLATGKTQGEAAGESAASAPATAPDAGTPAGATAAGRAGEGRGAAGSADAAAGDNTFAAAGADEDDEEDDDDPLRTTGRRRWPVVTATLLILFAVLAAGGFYGWHVTQNEYYVGTADGRVVVFRGVNQAVAGVSLSSTVQRTDIPIAAIPSGEAGQIQATIPAVSLSAARRIVSHIRDDYRCAVVTSAIRRWYAHRAQVTAANRTRAGSGVGRTTARRMASRSASGSKLQAKPSASTGPANTGQASRGQAGATQKNSAARPASGQQPRAGSSGQPNSKSSPAPESPKPVLPSYCSPAGDSG